MKITALVENTAKEKLKAKHGLSLYIETKKHKILFDLGPDDTLFENARVCGIDLSKVDIVIISHGHMDHGGALSKFLAINKEAKIYIQEGAFDKHFSKVLFKKIYIGLDQSLKTNSQITMVNGDYQIDEELYLFTIKERDKCHSPANDVLYDKNGRDSFLHEQNLVIKENQTALIMGCGHTGIVNIMERAEEYSPDVCVGGYHLFNPITKKSAAVDLLNEIIVELSTYAQTQFFTCHCTGTKAYEYLAEKMSNMSYLSCGESIEV
ncbi:MBL fold metallo-hydrolase [Candidatus Saccharibacteria bacterium]|jgi:7,8-dihydropterin-6-yl-methyl-4-(beta-D-ribofuranosyl)aminobenzene 5'-phosphate synthase|nr:MBL fold metallo-hydrolase [Candidatus Saccharibacteria bacterium]